MTEEIIIDKEEFWDMFEQHPINAVEGLFSKIETIVNLIKRLEQENKELKNKNICRETCEYFKRICNENTLLIKYRSALEEILESAKFAQCLPCGSGNLEDCLNCNDDTTNNGQFCMEKRIHEIKTKCVEVLNVSL